MQTSKSLSPWGKVGCWVGWWVGGRWQTQIEVRESERVTNIDIALSFTLFTLSQYVQESFAGNSAGNSHFVNFTILQEIQILSISQFFVHIIGNKFYNGLQYSPSGLI